jgi:hypothetical protein
MPSTHPGHDSTCAHAEPGIASSIVINSSSFFILLTLLGFALWSAGPIRKEGLRLQRML